jgi:excisionase family DNA binding protein
MATTHPRKIAPGEVSAADAERSLRRIASYRATAADNDLVEIGPEIGPDDKLVLPHPVFDMLVGILEATAAGRGVQVMPFNAELTTQQAAEALNVSRPYLIGLLESGEIEYRLVGRHRRVRFDKLMEYKAKDDATRRAVADDLSSLGQELGGD